jgi:hypothetical protein
VLVEPVSDPLPSDSGASDSPASDNDPPNGGDVSDAALIAYIRDHHDGVISVRTLQRANGKKFPTSDSAREALQGLVDAGHGSWVEEGRIFRLSERPAGP